MKPKRTKKNLIKKNEFNENLKFPNTKINFLTEKALETTKNLGKQFFFLTEKPMHARKEKRKIKMIQYSKPEATVKIKIDISVKSFF